MQTQFQIYFISLHYFENLLIYFYFIYFPLTFYNLFIVESTLNLQSALYIFLMICALFTFIFTTMTWITFQQCPSEGFDYSRNQVTNGQFQNPAITSSPTTYPGGFYPWTATLAQIGIGTDYNSNWGSTQVAALDSGTNQQYTQSFYIPYEGLFFFSISFAKRQGLSPSTSGLRIYWNGKNVAQQPTANDDLIHTITLNLTSIQGNNTIIIQAMGHDDGEGTTIDNVGVYPFVYFNRVEILGVCTCAPGFFDNGYNYPCVPCSQMIQFCSSCRFVPDLSLLPPDCTNNVTYGANCSFGAFTCTNCLSGYYLNLNGTCEPVQEFDSFYEPDWELEFIPCNNFKGVIELELPMYQTFYSINSNISQVSISSSEIIHISGDFYKFKIYASYNNDISDKTITFIIQYYDSSNTLNTAATIMKMKSDALPLVVYTESECRTLSQVQNLVIAIVSISYIVLFFSLISFKIVGLELFGVLQLAYFSLASHENVNLYLYPLLKWKYMNGFNVQTSQPFMNVSNSIYHMGYKDNFFFNINFMFALLIVDLIIGGIIFCVASKKENKKLLKIAMHTLKLIFITLFIFNSLNLSFSIGLHFKYADSLKTEAYGIGTFGALVGIGLFVFAAVYMQCTKEQEFGEFKNKFKIDCVNKFYIPLSIIYRFILGVYIAEENEWYLGTLIILAASLVFIIMYNVTNLPFKKAYQNYRANLCHFTQLLILLVSNYYRSMKANMSLDQKARIYWPAILQLIAICICMLVSFICLLFEIIRGIKTYLDKKTKQKTVNFQGIQNKAQSNPVVNSNQLNITQNKITQNQ